MTSQPARFRGFILKASLLMLVLSLSGCGSGSSKNYATDAARSFKKLWGSSGATVVARTLRTREPLLFLGIVPSRLAADSDYSCTSPVTTGSTTTFSCSNSGADSFTCQGTSYSWAAGGTMGVSFSVANVDTYTVGLNLSGTLTGGEFTDTGTSVSCSFNFTFDATGLASGEQYDLDCSNAGFSCNIGGQTLNCSDLSQAFKDTADSC